MMKRILVEIERPTHAESLGAMPDVDAELSKIDAFVNRLMTAASPIDGPSSFTPPPEYTTGRRPVSLRIPNRVINAFRAESLETGTSYQTLMIRALADAADDFAL
ncbi:MAG: hypothetical protein U1E12_22195 [Hydrogenophaga sp.]|nr:hypothetical protein [Hydrogenophaga sp.]